MVSDDATVLSRGGRDGLPERETLSRGSGGEGAELCRHLGKSVLDGGNSRSQGPGLSVFILANSVKIKYTFIISGTQTSRICLQSHNFLDGPGIHIFILKVSGLAYCHGERNLISSHSDALESGHTPVVGCWMCPHVRALST